MTNTRYERNRQALSTERLQTGLKGRVVRGSIVNLASQVAAIVIQLASSAILARLLLPDDYGLLAMAGTAVTLVAVLTNLELTTPTIQRPSITHEQVSTLFFINLAGGVVLFVLACSMAPLFGFIFHDERVTRVSMLLALLIPIGAATAQFNAVLARNMHWLTIQGINLAGQIVGAVVGILLAWRTDWGVYALLAQSLTSSSLVLVLTWAACPWRPSPHFDLKSVRSELSMGLNLLLFNLVNYLHRQGDNIILGYRWGPIELGYYSRAYNLMLQANSGISIPVANAMVPALSRVSGNAERWRKIFLDSASLTAAACGGLFAILWAVREPLIGILLGSRWHDVVPIFGYLAIAGLSTSVCSAFTWGFVTFGRTRELLYWILFAAPVLVVAFWFGASFGGVGVAIGYAVTIWVINFFYVAVALKGTPVTFLEGVSIKAVVYFGFAVMALGNFLVDRYVPLDVAIIDLVVRGALASMLYVSAVVLVSFFVPAFSGVQSLLAMAQSKFLG
jgi:PST family polysaccharide transporter